jgi:hypothetical protein
MVVPQPVTVPLAQIWPVDTDPDKVVHSTTFLLMVYVPRDENLRQEVVKTLLVEDTQDTTKCKNQYQGPTVRCKTVHMFAAFGKIAV